MDEITTSRLTIEIGASSDRATKQIKDITDALKSLRKQTNVRFQNPLKSLDGKGFDAAKLSSKLHSVDAQIVKTQKAIDVLREEIDGLSAAGNTKGIPALETQISSYQRLLQALGTQKTQLQSIIPSGEAGRAKGLAGLLQSLKSKIKLRIDSSDADKAHKKVGKLANILNSLKRIAFYRVIRSAIKAIGEAFSQGAENAYWYSKTMGDSTKYIADAYDSLASKGFTMQNQLGAAWATLKATITPILMEIVQLATMAAQAITQLFAALGGKGTYLKAVDYSKQWAENTARGAGAAKEWKNQLMGFDEINRLEEPSSGGGGGGSALPDYGNMFDESKLSAWAEKVKGTFDRIKKTVKNHLTEIELFASGALLGLGLILTLTGANVPLGLGLMVAGGIGLAKTITENWDWISANVGNALSSVELVAGGLLFGVGAVLAFSGANIPLGLGLMAVGALRLATIAALNWEEIPDNVRKAIGEIDLAVGGGLLAVGALLTFSGANIPIGIGLMLAGAAGLAAGAAINWDYIKQNVTHVLEEIGLVVGGALLALGAVIMFATPSFSPVGLGLIIAGVAALGIGTSLAIDWDSNPRETRSVISKIMLIIGASLAAIGLILCLTGAGIPLGIGLIIAGLGSAYASFKISDEIIRAVENACGEIWKIVKGLFVTIWEEFVDLIDGIIEGLNNVYNWEIWEGGRSYTSDGEIDQWAGMNFASGGFPDEGQLFFAREAGPELVGTMGGRTAVANNQEITEGIRQAVYDAFVAANGDGRDVSVRVYLDSQEIKVGQERLDRAWGV